MNDLLIVVLVLLGALPLGALILRGIFGKSIMFSLSMWSVVLVDVNGFFLYFAGSRGISHLLWALPATFGIGTVIFLCLNFIVRKRG